MEVVTEVNAMLGMLCPDDILTLEPSLKFQVKVVKEGQVFPHFYGIFSYEGEGLWSHPIWCPEVQKEPQANKGSLCRKLTVIWDR